jgi:hypothetical protein
MDVGRWLRNLSLEKYEAAFRENDIDETVLCFWHLANIPIEQGNVRSWGVRSTGQCNTACSLLAGVSKPKVFRGR